MNRRVLVLTCAVFAGLCLCLAVASVAGYVLYQRTGQSTPPETSVDLTGHMVIGFEIASFVPCGLEASGEDYWLSGDPGVELYDAYHASVGEDYTPSYIHVPGRLSTPGEHLILRVAPEDDLAAHVFFTRTLSGQQLPSTRVIQRDLSRTMVPFAYTLEAFVPGVAPTMRGEPHLRRGSVREACPALRRMNRRSSR